MSRGGLYAGWVVVDVRLLVFLVLLTLGISSLLLALLVRRRAWHEYVTLFISVSSLLFLLAVLLLQTILNYPVLVERDFFPLR